MLKSPLKKTIGRTEFIILMALIMSLTALAIDSILPAFAVISEDLKLSNPQDTQLIIVTLFFGMAFGQFFYGPLSDSLGRKPTIYIGIGFFLVGSLFAIFAESLSVMLIGRFIQGIGVASPRIVTMAIVRDSYKGKDMARIMSFMMSIFILIPIIAPSLGYWILVLSHWRLIYAFTALFSIVILVWFYLRQNETLKPEYQQSFHLKRILKNTISILKYKSVMGYTLMNGLIFGAFLAYLSASQHIFQNIYDTGSHFPYYFAALATAMGLSSFLNGKLVSQFHPVAITRFSLISIALLCSATLIMIYLLQIPLTLFKAMIFFAILYFMVGLLFGNINALAMEPIGHLAGVGAGVIGSISTFISIPLANLIGSAINTNIHAFIWGFLACSLLSILIQQAIKPSQTAIINPA